MACSCHVLALVAAFSIGSAASWYDSAAVVTVVVAEVLYDLTVNI